MLTLGLGCQVLHGHLANHGLAHHFDGGVEHLTAPGAGAGGADSLFDEQGAALGEIGGQDVL